MPLAFSFASIWNTSSESISLIAVSLPSSAVTLIVAVSETTTVVAAIFTELPSESICTVPA